MTPSRPPLELRYQPVERLIPYARNARTHSETQVAEIAGSMVEFGFTNPILVDEEGGIIAGHGRVLAARQLGMVEVPTITLRGLSKAQRRAYVLADNKLALNAGWNEELLALELQDLRDAGYNLALTGFGEQEVAAILKVAADGPADPLGENGFKHTGQFGVIVTAVDEAEQERIYDELTGQGYECKVVCV